MTKKDKLARVQALPKVVCPYCKNWEDHPTLKNSLGIPLCLIKTYERQDSAGKWWSHCLVCSGYYDRETLKPTTRRVSKTKGWFITGNRT